MNTRNQIIVAAILGQLVGLLGWIDMLFFPPLLAAPLVTGAIAAARGISLAAVDVLWFSAGLNMLWTDWVVNREDVLFHGVISVLMPLLAALGYGAVRLFSRRRTPARA